MLVNAPCTMHRTCNVRSSYDWKWCKQKGLIVCKRWCIPAWAPIDAITIGICCFPSTKTSLVRGQSVRSEDSASSPMLLMDVRSSNSNGSRKRCRIGTLSSSGLTQEIRLPMGRRGIYCVGSNAALRACISGVEMESRLTAFVQHVCDAHDTLHHQIFSSLLTSPSPSSIDTSLI